MRFEIRAAHLPLSFLVSAVLIAAAVGMHARRAFAVECSVTQDRAPSQADQAYLASNYAEAETLYCNGLKAASGNS